MSMIRSGLIAIVLVFTFVSPAYAGLIKVDIFQRDASGIPDLATAEAIAGDSANFIGRSFLTEIDLDDLGDGTTGQFSGNSPWPFASIHGNSSFVAVISGKLVIAPGETRAYGMDHDDGARLKIDGGIYAIADGVFDNRFTSGAPLLAGTYRFEILYFENFGGASLEFIETVPGSGVRNLVQAVPEPGTVALFGIGLAGMALSRRRKRV